MPNTEAAPAKPGFHPEFIDSRTLDRITFPHGWLVEHCLVAGQPCVVGGPKKTLKTSVVVDLAVSLGTGTPFLNHFPVSTRVRATVLSGESGAAGIQDAARRVAAAKGVTLEKKCGIDWCFRLPRLDRGADRVDVRARLLALPGIGPWTADYVAMRALGDPDVFLPTDVGVRRALAGLGLAGDADSAQTLSRHWRPWRSYGLMHLWSTLDLPPARGTSSVPAQQHKEN